MPQKQYTAQQIKDLEREIFALRQLVREGAEMIEKLSQDPSYGILTRTALEIEVEARKAEFKYLAFGDVDFLHFMNDRYGHEEMNNRIRRALHVRSGDVVISHLVGKFYSGDEIAILFDGDPDLFCKRYREAFEAEGMSITIVYVPFTGDFKRDAEKAKKLVFESKQRRERKSR